MDVRALRPLGTGSSPARRMRAPNRGCRFKSGKTLPSLALPGTPGIHATSSSPTPIGEPGVLEGCKCVCALYILVRVCSCRTIGVDGCRAPRPLGTGSSPARRMRASHRGYRVSPVRRVSERPIMGTGCPRYDDKGVVDWPSPQPSPTRRGSVWGSALAPAQPRLGSCRGVSCGRPWGRGAGERHYIQPARSQMGPRSESGKTSAGVGTGSSPARRCLPSSYRGHPVSVVV